MTALAGIVGLPDIQQRESGCGKALDAQRLYGRSESFLSLADATFAIRLQSTLPEDRHDRQPLATERLILIADVRLDNRAEILCALSEAPADWVSRSDAEVLFLAWACWNERCLDVINGDYAFAVYDVILRKLYLVRDPTGQRPLFYGYRSSHISFASMPSGLLADRQLRHNLHTLAGFLTGTGIPAEETYFHGVQRVLPGQIVVFSGTTRYSHLYWTPNTEPSEKSTPEQVELYRFHLDNAVRQRMRRVSSPLAIHLSSGYDSSSVAGTAARLSSPRDRIIAFTSAPVSGLASEAPGGRPVDETTVAAATARLNGFEHVVVQTSRSLLENVRGHSRYYQEPVRNVFNFGWWTEIRRRARALGANTLLTGEMGNFSLNAGGLQTLSEWIRMGSWIEWYHEAMSTAARTDVRWRGILMASFGPWLPPVLSEQLERLYVGTSWLSWSFVREELLRDIQSQKKRSIRSRPIERLADIRSIDPGVFRKAGLAETGVDERDPTADRRLIEFSLRIPPVQMLHHGIFRPLARDALADRVPPFVLNARVRAYQGADWMARLRLEDVYATLEEISSNSVVQELLDLAKLRRIITKWPLAFETSPRTLETVGRHLTNALIAGVFVAETERYPQNMGV